MEKEEAILAKVQSMEKKVVILAIESSCDDTSAAVIVDGLLRSNVIASQKVHEEYGGVVPELASRAHQQNILPVVDTALKRAGVTKEELSAIAFTRGPGLLGSLLVGTSFAKGLALALNIPLIDVNHLQGHVLAHFVEDGTGLNHPSFPFLCLLVSGGNSQIVKVESGKRKEEREGIFLIWRLSDRQSMMQQERRSINAPKCWACLIQADRG